MTVTVLHKGRLEIDCDCITDRETGDFKADFSLFFSLNL
jgi:hypothetical protein